MTLQSVIRISGYALDRGVAEAVAEAFVDWYANGENAMTLSEEIMRIVRKFYMEVSVLSADRDAVNSNSGEKGRRITPRFLKEGWALYEGGDYEVKTLKGRKIRYEKDGFDFIGVKPDAPDWAKEEYKMWISDY